MRKGLGCAELTAANDSWEPLRKDEKGQANIVVGVTVGHPAKMMTPLTFEKL